MTDKMKQIERRSEVIAEIEKKENYDFLNKVSAIRARVRLGTFWVDNRFGKKLANTFGIDPVMEEKQKMVNTHVRITDNIIKYTNWSWSSAAEYARSEPDFIGISEERIQTINRIEEIAQKRRISRKLGNRVDAIYGISFEEVMGRSIREEEKELNSEYVRIIDERKRIFLRNRLFDYMSLKDWDNLLVLVEDNLEKAVNKDFLGDWFDLFKGYLMNNHEFRTVLERRLSLILAFDGDVRHRKIKKFWTDLLESLKQKAIKDHNKKK